MSQTSQVVSNHTNKTSILINNSGLSLRSVQKLIKLFDLKNILKSNPQTLNEVHSKPCIIYQSKN